MLEYIPGPVWAILIALLIVGLGYVLNKAGL